LSWIYVAQLEEIPRRGARVLHIDEEAVALFRTSEDAVFALRDRCPHEGGPLSQGIVHGNCVTCPLHDWVIDLSSGAAVGPDEGITGVFAVRIDDGRIYLAAAEHGAAKAPGEAGRSVTAL
jgi:nitrite reductase (NADH) small subunit